MKTIKKITGIIVTSCVIISGVNASFLVENIDPVCGITGETFRISAAGKSDTSSWEIPVAYSGECKKTPELSLKLKEKIYKISSKFFSKYAKYDSRNNVGIVPNSGGIDLNFQGEKIVKDKLFPAIKKIISQEIKKDKPNYRKIAVLNYFAKTIGYDYYISMPR